MSRFDILRVNCHGFLISYEPKFNDLLKKACKYDDAFCDTVKSTGKQPVSETREGPSALTFICKQKETSIELSPGALRNSIFFSPLSGVVKHASYRRQMALARHAPPGILISM
ncbi:hypothetical protein WA026_001431 [Henosepilachna vigintioctopunctata]|uniref:Uncharacterized protein n=1 Tax=Henosepilachna vigintioctopunctata TaxID=420089 RepID=A0AAW1UI84_9CUCU